MLACKPSDTPTAENVELGIFQDQIPTNKERYQRLVGRLMYLSYTRPDLAYSLSVVSQYMHSSSEEHLKAVFRILQYLKSPPGKKVLCSPKALPWLLKVILMQTGPVRLMIDNQLLGT